MVQEVMLQNPSAPGMQRRMLPTDLGACEVAVQSGTKSTPIELREADVYLHGAAGTWRTFLPLLQGAPERDRILIDLPGWGGSTSDASPQHLDPATISSVIVQLLDSLGYPRWNLIGHSMGGFLALHIAATYPDRAASVTAISATTLAAAEASRAPLRSLFSFPSFVGMLLLMRFMAALGLAGSALVRTIGCTPAMGLLMSPFFAERSAIPSEVVRSLGRDARPAGFAAAARAAAQYDFNQWRDIRCPALAVRGESDVFSPPSDAARLADLVPHLRNVTLAQCGHFAHVEQPAQVQRLLLNLHNRRMWH